MVQIKFNELNCNFIINIMRKEHKQSSYNFNADQEKSYLRGTIGAYQNDNKKYHNEALESNYDKSASYKFLRHTINQQSNLNYYDPKTKNESDTLFSKERKYGDLRKKTDLQYKKNSESSYVPIYGDYKYKTQSEKESYDEISSPLRKARSPNRQRMHTQDNITLNATYYDPYTPNRQSKNQSKLFSKKQSYYEKTYVQPNSPQRYIGAINDNFRSSRAQDKISSPYITKQRNASQILTSSTYRSPTKKPKLCLNDFSIGKCLGQGKFGNVYISIHKDTGSLFALKKVKKSQIKEHKLENQFMMEIKMQLHFNHKHILALYGFFDDSQYIYLILEFMEEGSLYSYFKKKNILTQEDTSRKMNEILKSIYYLHSKNIAHRDIKPQNIVMSSGVSKLCDFGWSAICQDRRRTLCGTPDYLSPDVLKGQQYGIQVDLWCIGVLCYELLVGKSPFYHIKIKQTMSNIMDCDLSKVKFPQTLSAEAEDFIRKLLVKDAEKRMNAGDALKHKFILKHMQEEEKEKTPSKKTY